MQPSSEGDAQSKSLQINASAALARIGKMYGKLQWQHLQSEAVSGFRCCLTHAVSLTLAVVTHLLTRPSVSLVQLLMKLKYVSDQQQLQTFPCSGPPDMCMRN